MQFISLSEAPHLLPQVARWYFDTWGRHLPGMSLDDEQVRLEVYLQQDELPLLLLAIQDQQLVGAAQLKFHERTERPERLHWLGGVYVCQAQRGHGLAARLIEEVMSRGRGFGVRDVYLQTERDDGGLYRRLGWKPLEMQVHASGVPVRIMQRSVSATE
jgi:GNAT superfamily N-acetyltransferase